MIVYRNHYEAVHLHSTRQAAGAEGTRGETVTTRESMAPDWSRRGGSTPNVNVKLQHCHWVPWVGKVRPTLQHEGAQRGTAIKARANSREGRFFPPSSFHLGATPGGAQGTIGMLRIKSRSTTCRASVLPHVLSLQCLEIYTFNLRLGAGRHQGAHLVECRALRNSELRWATCRASSTCWTIPLAQKL